VQVISGALEDGLRRELDYAGDLLVFKDVGSMAELCDLVDELIREAFGASDPLRVQFELEKDDCLHGVEVLQKHFRKNEQTKRLFMAALESAGVDPRRAFWDRPYLRVSPHGDEHGERRTSKLGLHRDTWSSNVYSQTNW
jgi:hypothetical protein